MQIIKKNYPNGLRSLSVLSQDTQSVTIMFLVAVGSRFEVENEAGLAHFVEHTLFKGTKNRPDTKQIGMEIESLGGSTNAFTSQDYTGYYIKAPAVNFSQNFDILADMFKNSEFKEEYIEKEKGVIVEEIRMYEDSPISKISQEWQRNFFLDNKLGEDTAGTIESVKNMKRDQFFQYLNKHYYAENVLLVVAGNVSEQQVEEMVNKHCLDIQSRGEKPASNFQTFQFVEDPRRQKLLHVQKDVQQTHIVLGGPSIHRDDDRKFALQVTNAILSEGFASRLFQVIRDELGLAYYIYSRLMAYRDTGVFQIAMGVDSQRVDEALAATKKQLDEIKQGKFADSELQRAKNYLLGNIVTELETTDEMASFYGMQELLNYKKYDIEEVKRKIMEVNREQITAITSEIFKEENYFTAVLSK